MRKKITSRHPSKAAFHALLDEHTTEIAKFPRRMAKHAYATMPEIRAALKRAFLAWLKTADPKAPFTIADLVKLRTELRRDGKKIRRTPKWGPALALSVKRTLERATETAAEMAVRHIMTQLHALDVHQERAAHA